MMWPDRDTKNPVPELALTTLLSSGLGIRLDSICWTIASCFEVGLQPSQVLPFERVPVTFPVES